MKKIFISRNIKAHDPIVASLKSKNFELISYSLIKLSPKPFEPISSDWIFFYSQNAVGYYFAKIQQLKPSVKIAAMGEKTAAKILSMGHAVDFIGNGEPQSTAKSFLNLSIGQRVLFPRAENSRNSIQKIIAGKITALDLVVYENKAKKDFELPMTDVLLFTSPLNVEAFFLKYPLPTRSKIMAIGLTTAKTLFEKGADKVYIPSSPSIEKALFNI